MNYNARTMLEALKGTSNENTRESVKYILENKAMGPGGRLPQDLVEEGFFGDFLKAVWAGDYLAAYGAADFHNQRALRGIIAPDNERF